MTEIDLLEKGKQAIEFEPIAIPEDTDISTLHSMLDAAHDAHGKYKAMLEAIRAADAVTDGIDSGSYTWEFMTEEDETPTYEDSALDVISTLKPHLIKQVARFAQLQKDLEAEIGCAVQQARDDATYGTYDEQVASQYWGSR